MLNRKGQIKILDFGLARLMSDTSANPGISSRLGVGRGTLAGDVMGTPDFMAPEQTVNSSRVDIRADIYSLGCTLYYLLSGQAPFGDGSPLTKLFFHGHHQPRPVKELCRELPGGLAAVVTKMMAKDPAERYQTPADVVKALAPFARASLPLPTSEAPHLSAPKVPAPDNPNELVAPSVAGNRLHVGKTFLSRCRYCPTRIRVPDRALGASVLCPRCGNYFTAAPEES